MSITQRIALSNRSGGPSGVAWILSEIERGYGKEMAMWYACTLLACREGRRKVPTTAEIQEAIDKHGAKP